MTLRLLLAGKDIASFQPIRKAFANEDVHIIKATSIGLGLFLSRKNLPHLIICEEQLIDGDGISFFYEIRNEPDFSEIPFAFLLTDKKAQTNILDQLGAGNNHTNIHFFFITNDSEQQDTMSWKNEILQIVN